MFNEIISVDGITVGDVSVRENLLVTFPHSTVHNPPFSPRVKRPAILYRTTIVMELGFYHPLNQSYRCHIWCIVWPM